MYENFYHLNAKPFGLSPNSSTLFESRQHTLAASILDYAIGSELALTVVTGDVGAGKTSLIRRLLSKHDEEIDIGLISNTHSAFGNLMQWVALAFDLPFKNKDKVELYHDFVAFLIDQYAVGRKVVLIVDEAQNLDIETLEELRLLTNINADDHLLLQLVLVGQPELHERLKQPELRQLAQRIGVTAKLGPLDEKETAAYVRHRLAAAGGDPGLFHKNALRLIHFNSGGIPRVINTLCELALVYGFADSKATIDAELIADIARDRIDTGLYGEVMFDTSALSQVRLQPTNQRVSEPADRDQPKVVDLAFNNSRARQA